MNYKETFKEDEVIRTNIGKLVLVTVDIDGDSPEDDERFEEPLCGYCFFNNICEGDREEVVNSLGFDCGDSGFFIMEK